MLAERVLADGYLDDGRRIRVTEGRGHPPQRFTVFIDGRTVPILDAQRLRDGGTTIIEIAEGTFVDGSRRLFAPGPITFNGVEISPP